MHIIVNKKYLTFKNFKVKCAVGRRGIRRKKREGDLVTPKGTFKIKQVLLRKDRVSKFQSKLLINNITKNMGWCDDPRSNKYNQLIKQPFSYNSEKLYRSDKIYDIIVVLDFNMNPTYKNKGSAIFIHVAKNNYSPTKGCIALKRIDLKRLLKIISKKTKVKIY